MHQSNTMHKSRTKPHNSNTRKSSNPSNQSKKVTPITSLALFPPTPVFTTAYPTPSMLTFPSEPNFDLPTYPLRAPALLARSATLLGSTFGLTKEGKGQSISSCDVNGQELTDDGSNALVKIILHKRRDRKVLKLGDHQVNIFSTKRVQAVNPVVSSTTATATASNTSLPSKPLVNKFLDNKVLDKETYLTPAKRIRDEVIDASSSVKKNKRMLELSAMDNTNNTTMELSFEGKAMGKMDYVRLVDDTVDESILHQQHLKRGFVNTENLLDEYQS